MSEYKVPISKIESFLHGHDPEKYIVGLHYVKSENKIYKIKENPDTKEVFLETDTFTPFLWMRELDVIQTQFYGGNMELISAAKSRHGIKIKKLDTHNHGRIDNGYKYLVESTKSYSDLLNFLKFGGLSTYVNEFELIGVEDDKIVISCQSRSEDRAIEFFEDNTEYDARNPDITRQYKINKVPIFVCPRAEEQFLISRGKRLFKGYEDYDEVHKLVFDLETEGLDPSIDRIFLAGMKDNRGFEELIHAESDDESERNCIRRIFEVIDEVRPAIIGTYNGAFFDWPFIYKRCEILGLDVKELAKTLHPSFKIYDSNATLKLGNETQDYTQTNIWGYSIIDISHSSLRAQAIDSGMKSWSLKYVCQYNDVAKRNRVYIDGRKLAQTWEKNEKFWFTDISGKYSKQLPALKFVDEINEQSVIDNPQSVYVIGSNHRIAKYSNRSNLITLNTTLDPSNKKKLKKAIIKEIEPIFNAIHAGKTLIFDKNGLGHSSDTNQLVIDMYHSCLKLVRKRIESYKEVNGRYLLRRYLMDDLWETNEVDEIYNQSSFLLAKLVPTTYQRVVTMGTAGLWQLIMLAWSYETGTAVPKPDLKREFTGGLSRVLDVGFNRDVSKIDYSSLYPALQLAHDILPSVDVTGAMKSLLKYFHSERFKAKDLASKYKAEGNKTLASKYKRKQLPLKIFINSMYGALTAPHAFYWAEMDKGELVTCLGRQYLRLAVRYHKQLGFKALVLDTDGVNFKKPEGLDEFKYVGRGQHDRTELGVEYHGIDAVIAKFNDLYMMGEMAVDLDGEWPACINYKRKNYALLEYSGKISLTGNTIKSRGMSEYLNEFIDKGVSLLLLGKGQEFIDFYYQYVKDIVTYKMPLKKMASKARAKETINAYQNRGTDKTGRIKAKKAHMELLIANKLTPKLGDTVYYINNGLSASDGDVSEKFERDEKGKLIKYKVNDDGDFELDENGELIVDKKGKKRLIGINSYMLTIDDIENNPEAIGKYNYKKYLKALNTRLEGLLSPFKPEIRDKILLNYTVKVWDENKNRNVNVDINSEELVDAHRGRFLNEELELCSGQPIKEADQDTLEELFTPEDKEMAYWEKYHVGEPYDPRIWDDQETMSFYVPKFNKEPSEAM